MKCIRNILSKIKFYIINNNKIKEINNNKIK